MKFKSIFLAATLFVAVSEAANVNIVIHHWGDINSQLERFYYLNKTSDKPIKNCQTENRDSVCSGGLAYLEPLIHQRDPLLLESNLLKLSTGNLVGGENGWLSINTWDEFGKLIGDFYKPTAMSAGINDFGSGLKRTISYFNQTAKMFEDKFNPMGRPVLSNIKCDVAYGNKSDEEVFCTFIEKYKIVNVVDVDNKNVSVGVVGFVNENVDKLGDTGKLVIEKITDGLKAAIVEMRRDHSDVNFIIAIGDGSRDIATKIVNEVPEIRLVLYGRSIGNDNIPDGTAFPESVLSSYIASAGKYGQHMGKIMLSFESTNGRINSTAGSQLVHVKGNPSSSVIERISPFAIKVMAAGNRTVGRTHVGIQGGQVCWKNECNLGNIMADAVIHCAYNSDKIDTELPEGTMLAVWHAGALFYDKIARNQKISELDVHLWLPFHNLVHLAVLNGSSIRAMFEASATALDDTSERQPRWGQFLQVSNGMAVYYKKEGGKGSVESVRVFHDDDDNIPKMDDISDSDLYLIAMPSFLHDGRSIYGFLPKLFLTIPNTKVDYYNIGFDDTCLQNYINKMGTIISGMEERIFVNADRAQNTKCKNNTAKAVLLTLFLTLLILGGVFVGWKFIYPRFSNNHNRFS